MLSTENAAPVTIHCPGGHRTERGGIRTRELGPATVLLAVHGEVDAATMPGLFDTITAHAHGYRQVVLDLSLLDFFGAAGYSLLHRLQMHCIRAGVDWAVVTGQEVQRLLRVCDSDGLFPVAPNIVSAVAALTRGPHRTSHLLQ